MGFEPTSGGWKKSAIAHLMFYYGPEHEGVVVEYAATRNHSIMLAVTSRLVNAVEAMSDHGLDRPVQAA